MPSGKMLSAAGPAGSMAYVVDRLGASAEAGPATRPTAAAVAASAAARTRNRVGRRLGLSVMAILPVNGASQVLTRTDIGTEWFTRVRARSGRRMQTGG